MRNRPLHPSSRSRGFTFAEIMFAVMILGIGFIMVAAMFPVAIRQTQSTLEEMSGVAEAKRGAALMRQLGTSFSGYVRNYANQSADLTKASVPAFANIVVDPQTYSPARAGSVLHSFFLPGPSGQVPYDFVKGDMIGQVDSRFAWVPVAYQADQQPSDSSGNPLAVDANGLLTVNPTTGAPEFDANNQPRVATARVLPQTARVWVVAIQKRNPDSPQFTAADRDANTPSYTANPFKPKQVYFKLVEGEDPNAAVGGNIYPDTIVFTDAGGTPTDDPNLIGAAAPGAYVWVSDDSVTTVPTGNMYPGNYRPGAANGRIYRLGSKLAEDTYGPGVWELQPGNDMQIRHSPGADAYYNTADDTNDYELENLPPRQYDGANHPYSVGASGYSSLPGPPAKGLMIGRALKNPAQPYSATNPYVGDAQDVYAMPPVTVILNAQ